jgi:hypothetical protein
MRLTEAHWLALGMEVPILLDPAEPERFEVQWDQVQSMEARAAANDPALADPIAARRRVATVLGLTRTDTGHRRTDRVERALADVAGRPAPAGWLCAVVIIASIRGRRVILGDSENAATHDAITYRRGSDAVLSVNVAGRRPYAVFAPRFKCEVDLLDPFWEPLPALVPAESPSTVEVRWDEVSDHDQQVRDRIAGSIATQQDRAALVADFSRVDMAGLAAENARRTLHYVQDPKMKKMLIEQYRAAGIDISGE